MNNTNQTWVIKNKEGKVINRMSYNSGKEVRAIYYGKLKEVIQLITYKEWLQMATLEIINKGNDKVKHRPLRKRDIEKILLMEVN